MFSSVCIKLSETVKKAGVSSYFPVEILYEGIFGQVATFWVFTHVKIVLIVTAANILIKNQLLFAYLEGKSAWETTEWSTFLFLVKTPNA